MQNKLKMRQTMCYNLNDHWPETNVGQVKITRAHSSPKVTIVSAC